MRNFTSSQIKLNERRKQIPSSYYIQRFHFQVSSFIPAYEGKKISTSLLLQNFTFHPWSNLVNLLGIFPCSYKSLKISLSSMSSFFPPLSFPFFFLFPFFFSFSIKLYCRTTLTFLSQLWWLWMNDKNVKCGLEFTVDRTMKAFRDLAGLQEATGRVKAFPSLFCLSFMPD